MQIMGAASSNIQAAQNTSKSTADNPQIRNLQNQIAELQKQIQSLSENESLDAKAKSEKKQELQKQIASINAEIRQIKLQEQKEKQAAAKPAESKQEPKKFKDGFDEDEASTLLSASGSLEQTKAIGAVIKSGECRAKILTSQIETDKSRGADTSAKEKELAKIEESVNSAKNGLSGEAEKSSETLDDKEKAAKTDEGKEEAEAADREKSEEGEKRSGAVVVNVGKRNRQISAAKTLSQIQMVLSLVQKDVSDCKSGKEQGMCDDDEIAKAEALLQQAQEKLSEIRGQSDEELEENEKDMSFYTTLLM